MESMKKLLIIGANGFTGRYLYNAYTACKEYTVTGCSLHPSICQENLRHFVCIDICKSDEVVRLLEAEKPDIVINTSALSVPDYCEKHHEEAFNVNVTAVASLADACQKQDCRLIHLSTDFVFDGKTHVLYKETDEAKPVNYYGFTKLESEKAVVQKCSKYNIVRVAVVYGKNLPGQHGNIFQLVADRLRKGEIIRAVSDQWRTPTYVGDIAAGINLLILNLMNGTFHICGNECLSIAEIAYRVADFLKLDKNLIQAVSTEEMQENTPRPCFSGLSIEKAQKSLAYCPRTLEEGMELMFKSY
jgi:dTDP-4-dehydrorhamnose reductase